MKLGKPCSWNSRHISGAKLVCAKSPTVTYIQAMYTAINTILAVCRAPYYKIDSLPIDLKVTMGSRYI
jgi:hypothetical protein